MLFDKLSDDSAGSASEGVEGYLSDSEGEGDRRIEEEYAGEDSRVVG